MLIGLTGGPASGKTLVAREFKKLGACVIDADRIARDVLRPGTDSFRAVVEEFGRTYLTPWGEIDRKALGELIFNDPEKRARLNALTHPAIIDLIKEEAGRIAGADPGQIIVIDAPLLMEVSLDGEVDTVVVVDSDREDQIRRMIERDSITKEIAEARLSCQIPLKEKVERADHVIDNRGSVEETLASTRRLFDTLKHNKE